MNKIIFYTVLIVSIVGVLFYFLGESGLLGGALGLLGIGGTKALNKIRNDLKILDQTAEDIEAEIGVIDKELKNNEVSDLTPEEEANYWKKQ